VPETGSEIGGIGRAARKRDRGLIWVNDVAAELSDFRVGPHQERFRRPSELILKAMPMSGNDVVAVVDDDLAVLDSLKCLLESAGHTVAAYRSASAFLDQQASPPACLIVDQHMPEMTGLQLVARLRAEAAAVPALLITGAPSAAIVARAKQLGVRLLEKPPVADDVLTFIDAHVRGVNRDGSLLRDG
jgi:two-component system response regulator FixJ